MTHRHPLNERERVILRSVVQCFIHTADPVGSRFLARHYGLGLSPASIRNTLSDLEELGYLDHPYTSAGRVPTELGYRAYVDALMDVHGLSGPEREQLLHQMARLTGDTGERLRESSRLLGRLSNLLGVVLSPRLSAGILTRLDVVQLSSTRVMFVISVRSGLVKTIVLEVDSELRREELDQVVDALNERLSGLTLEEIRRTFASRVRDLGQDRNGIIRLFMKEANQLFSEPEEARRVSYSGTQNIVAQPEFQEPSEVRNVIELLEDADAVVHLLEEAGEEEPGRAKVSIGKENPDEKADRFSIVSARYRLGENVGMVGVIGPMRMEYSRVIALVEEMAELLSRTGDE